MRRWVWNAVWIGSALSLLMTACGGSTSSSITSVTVTPNPATATIGTQVQFTTNVTGAGIYSGAVTWSLAGPSGSSLSPGTLTSSGLYTTPYPAPATVTVTATSTQDTSKSDSATVTLTAPAAAAGPALTVDAGNQTHAISPYIYGMNDYLLDAATVTGTGLTVTRWGGDNTSRYNYQTNTSNSGADWYFENSSGSVGQWPDGNFNDLVAAANQYGIKTLGTVPVQGYVANSNPAACSFTQTSYPGQQSYSGNCGNGVYADGTNGCSNTEGCDLFGPGTLAFDGITSISEPPPVPPAASAATGAWAQGTWAGGWVDYLVGKFGTAGSGTGVAIYELDNEPDWWDYQHRDVHPVASTYDEVNDAGIGSALAIKTADPSAEVSGPVVAFWWNYFYSKKDIENGWSNGSPCEQPWSNPTDREAHGGVPFIEYYLQQFNTAETTYGKRLLDYLDMHTYFAADYPNPTDGSDSVAFTTAGDTSTQQARLNSTRVFWDPTYTDPNYSQPNYITDPNYTASCSTPLQAPQLIPMMRNWAAADYPGTKLAITEYNWGGVEAMNGALAQADILGIFGREGLDLGTMFPTGTNQQTDSSTQGPVNFAFAIYRNYDGANSRFGDTALASTSANQGQLSVYAAIHTSGSANGTVTIVVINKTYGDLASTLSLANLTGSSAMAQAYLYSNAKLNAIVGPSSVTLTPPVSGSTTSTIINYTFPAQSITLFVVPN
jgi:hypothetical protein